MKMYEASRTIHSHNEPALFNQKGSVDAGNGRAVAGRLGT